MKRILVIVMFLPAMVVQVFGAAPALRVQHRRPAAAAMLQDGRVLCVANRRSGTLSLIETAQWTVSEKQIGQELSDIVSLPDGNEILVSDFAAGVVVVLRIVDGQLTIVDRVNVASSPVSISANETGSFACVASLWSRRLTILERERSDIPERRIVRKKHQIDLPFAPRASAFVDASRVVVADSFGGRFAVVDCATGLITASHELPVHNIRDMTVGGDGRLYVTCQRLNPKGYTSSEDIHWGILIENEILAVPVRSVLAANGQLAANVERIALGGPGNGAGDPEAVLVTPDRLLVTLAGTDELAVIDRVGVRETRIPSGSRPVAMTRDPMSNRVFVVNSLSDSVSVIDLSSNPKNKSISLGPVPETGPVERGELAFFNAKLSLEGWMSCQSCHTDGHTNNGLADTLGDGDFGAAKRVPTLRGVWSTGPWGWNGSQHQLHGQIQKSLSSTMHHGVVADALVTDLTTYVSKLERVPSVIVARDEEPHPSVGYKAREVFESAGCSVCHNGFTSYTTNDSFDVGLRDVQGNFNFNPPSLSGVSQRDRFFHDGRAGSLEEVLIRFKHPGETELTDSERDVLISFLRAL